MGMGTHLEVIPLREEHIKGASKLFIAAYRAERSIVPLLPAKYETEAEITAFLRKILAESPGVGAMQGNRLVGFLTGFLLPSFRGDAGVYCPELAHAAAAEDRRRIYNALYTALSARWVAEGYRTHAITCLAHENETIETFFWLGFGMTAEDAIRDLNLLPAANNRIEVRRAGVSDADALAEFYLGMRAHIEAAPTFRVKTGEWERDHVEAVLRDSSRPVWIAFQDGIPAAFLGADFNYKESCYVIRDVGTLNLVAAFCDPRFRRSGIMTALLNTALAYARSVGMVRCSGDYEPDNASAVGIWSKYFTPVCHSLIRTIDSRAGGTYRQ